MLRTGVPTTLHLALGNESWEGTPNTSLGRSVVTPVPEDDADNARINVDSSSNNNNNKNVSYVFQRLATPFPFTPGGQQRSLSDDNHDDDNSPATLGKNPAPSDAPDSSGFASVGQCVSRAVELASEILCPLFAREIEKVKPARLPMELEQSAVVFSPRNLTGESGVGLENDAEEWQPLAKSEQIELREDHRSSSNDARAGRGGTDRDDVEDAAEEEGEGEDQQQESIRGNDQHDNGHQHGKKEHHNDQDVFAVADLLWSAESETHLDRISGTVMTLLATLDREAPKLTAADAPGTPPPDRSAMRGALLEVLGPRGVGMGAETEEDAVRWREGTEAAQLLGRILSLGLCKHDVEEDAVAEKTIGRDEEKDREEKKWGRAERLRDGATAGDGEGMPGGESKGGTGREEGGQREGRGGAANEAGVLLRDLYDNLGSFASGNERLEAMNTLLLAACYCKGVSSRTGGSGGWVLPLFSHWVCL